MNDTPELARALKDRDGVIDVATAKRFLTRKEIRSRVESGRWQQVAWAVLVAHNGPLTEGQRLRVALLRAGPDAAIGGFAAARLDGLKWYASSAGRTDVLVPRKQKTRPMPEFLNVTVHYSRALGLADVHPLHQPRRTRVERSLADAASWAPSDRLAMAVLAAGVQQGLTSVGKLRGVLDRNERRYRHRLISEALDDIEGGAHALSELDFTRKVVRAFGLPEPERQSARRDEQGRRRYLDVVWDRWKVAAEIDGAQHFRDPLQSWDDMERDIDLQINGYLVMRIPAWMVRTRPDYVAWKIRTALLAAGAHIGNAII
jgi:hypothetical protein